MPRSRADIVLEWEKLLAACRANPEALANVGIVLQELDTLLAEIRTLGVLQDAQTAAVQQTAKDIVVRVKRGTLLAGRLRSAAKGFYGDRTEKVIEFGMRPFRKPVRSQKNARQGKTPTKEAASEATEPTT